jgi:hypothetical protein
MGKTLLLIVLFIAFFSLSCKEPFFVEKVISIYVKNATTEKLSFIVSKTYPDTAIPSDKAVKGLNPKDSVYADFNNSSFEKLFQSLPADTLSIIFFSRDTLEKYTWEEMRSGYKILKRYDMSLQDLKQNKYIVTYQ